MRQAIASIHYDRPTSLGLLAGTLVAVVGVGVYIGRPLLTEEYYDPTEPLVGAAVDMAAHPWPVAPGKVSDTSAFFGPHELLEKTSGS